MNEHHLIERILTLLNFLAQKGLTLDDLLVPGCQPEKIFPQNSQNLRSAYDSLRFMEEMPGGFLIYFAEGDERIIYANRSLLRIFQCETMQQFRELTGNSFQGIVYPDDLDAVEESIYQQVSDSQYDLDYVEYRIRRADGSIRWVEDFGHFIRCGPAGNVFYVFISDCTEKRSHIPSDTASADRNEARLRSLIEAYDKERALINQEYLRQLEVIEGLSLDYESIFYVDLYENTIQPYRMSRRTNAFFEGDTPPSYSGYMAAYVSTCVFREDREMFSSATTPEAVRLKLAGEGSCYINYRVNEDGELKYLQLRAVNVGGLDAAQAVIGCRRVDDELQREIEQRQLLSEALENANLAIVAKNTFLSNMSHDLRTPLNAIFGFLSLAKTSLDDKESLLEYLDGAEGSSRQLLTLIDEVLQVSWNGSNETQNEDQKCDLVAIVRETCELELPKALEKGINLTLDTASLTCSAIYSSPPKLRQIVTNLIDNAIAYTDTGGSVAVTLSQRSSLSDQYVICQLDVADNGIGISTEFLGRIFEPFMRERNTTQSGVHGVGLGLTIVKRIVDRMGGSITVKSTPGEGSTFTVIFRLRLQRSEHTNNSHTSSAGARHLAGKRVLLVDDNEINLKIETKIFQELGFQIETAKNGRIAFEKVRDSLPGTYNLILMDIQMPVMDGWQSARAIRALKNPLLAHIPIIALTANVFKGDIRKSIESGMDAHLTKPLDVPSLISTVSEVLQRRQLL